MDKKQKGAMARLFLMMIVSAGLETGAVMMVMAVVQLILDPVALEQGETYQRISSLLNLQDTVQFSVAAILFLIVLYIAKNSFQFLFQRSLYRFVYSNQFKTASSLMKNFVRREYGMKYPEKSRKPPESSSPKNSGCVFAERWYNRNT